MKKIFFFFLCFVIAADILQAQQNAKTIKKAVPGKAANTIVSSGSSMLYGMFSAPAGTGITIQNNGKNDFALAVQKENGKTYGTSSFNLPTALSDGAKFAITLKKIANAQTCSIYAGAEGSMPQSANTLRIGCDFTYELVSRSSDNKVFSTFYESNDPAIGGGVGEDGRYIAFISSAVGFGGSTGKYRQVFWRDRNTGVTKLISAAPNGEAGNGDCYAPAISGDGSSVAFESYSSNLVESDKNGLRDIFIWHSSTNTIERVSIGAVGKEANGESVEASVSGDGNLVAFTSAADNISTNGKGVSSNNVFLHDLKKGTTIMISIDPIKQTGGGGSRPSISYDGNRVAFYSNTNMLVTDDNNGIWDIFLWEKDISKLKRISLTADGKERNQGNESANRVVSPAISGNGQYIAFTTTATNMVSADINNYQDVFVYDIATGNTVIASKAKDGKPGNADSPIGQGEKIAISFDGKWVAFSTNATNLGVPAANVVMRNMSTGENRVVSSIIGSSVGRPSMSQAGGYVVFGIGGKLDTRFPSSGIFANYTGVGLCRSCPQ
jgi:hypothetical protein